MGNVGNIEKVMVFGILLIIVGILGIAIWGNNTVEEPRYYEPAQDARASDDLNALNTSNTLTPPLKTTVEEPTALDPGSLIQDGDAPFLPIGDDVAARGAPADVSYPPRPQVVDEQGSGSGSTGLASATGTNLRTYTVLKGDTMGSIAKQIYGSARHAVEIQKANEDVDPKRMRVGQLLNLPRLLGLDEGPGADVRGRSETTSADRDASRSLGTKRTYEVVKGDTLFGIAREVLGGSARWRELFEANQDKLASPNDLKPGMLLILPGQ